MSNLPTRHAISSIEDLHAERLRLEALIYHQKNIIRQDIEDLKEEVKQEIRPVAEAATFVKKLTSKETRNDSMLHVGSTVLIEAIVRRVFAKSNFLIQLVVPNLVKNYSTHVLFNLMKNIAQKRQHGHHSIPTNQS